MSKIYIKYEEIEEIKVDVNKQLTIILKPIGGTHIEYKLIKTEGTAKLRNHLLASPDVKKSEDEEKESIKN